MAAMQLIWGFQPNEADKNTLSKILDKAAQTRQWMTDGIYESRAKDYTNAFRKIPYETTEEMNNVVGKLEDNSFIKQQRTELEKYLQRIAKMKEECEL